MYFGAILTGRILFRISTLNSNFELHISLLPERRKLLKVESLWQHVQGLVSGQIDQL